MHLKVPLKKDSELCVLLDCICLLYIFSSCFSIGLLLLVENCFVLLHRQDCCHVGPAALTASVLLKAFQYFSFNTGVLQLICTISWKKEIITPRATVPCWNCDAKASKHFSKSCSPTFIHELKFADGECCGIAGTEPQEMRVPPAELKGCTGGEEGGNEAFLLCRSGALQDGDRGRKLPAELAATKGSQPQKKPKSKKTQQPKQPPSS